MSETWRGMKTFDKGFESKSKKLDLCRCYAASSGPDVSGQDSATNYVQGFCVPDYWWCVMGRGCSESFLFLHDCQFLTDIIIQFFQIRFYFII